MLKDIIILGELDTNKDYLILIEGKMHILRCNGVWTIELLVKE